MDTLGVVLAEQQENRMIPSTAVVSLVFVIESGAGAETKPS